MSNYELTITNRGVVQIPSVIEPIILEEDMRGAPSKLTFTVIKGQKLDFQEGNPVRFLYNGTKVFFGYVFTKTRDRDHHIKVTCYDQRRYLKNKDTLVFEGKKAGDILKHIASVNGLRVGQVDDTGFTFKSLVFDNKSYFDMIYDALDDSMVQTKKIFILTDEFGTLTLKNMEGLKVDGLVLDDQNVSNFSYESSIDSKTYNQIKLTYENKEEGKREVYMAKDSEAINRWGLLQHYETINENDNGQMKADALLEIYNRKTRKLRLSGIKGDPRVRAGWRVMVMMNLGDIIFQNYLVVNSVRHTFSNDEHLMDISVLGSGFDG